MKFKQQPNDFCVEECTSCVPSSGEHSLYKLTKSGWTTSDALAVVRRRWKLAPSRFSVGGLKDRHAHTVQYFSIHHGPQRNLRQQNIEVEYLGQTPNAFTSELILHNRFVISIRDCDLETVETAERQLEFVRKFGLPNYFDDQRFGSVRSGNEFVAKKLVLGQYEDALRISLCSSSSHDRSVAKKQKQQLQTKWGDWSACLRVASRGVARRPLEHLQRCSGDFLGALLHLPTELRTLHLAAYQSHLWNRILERWLREHFNERDYVEVSLFRDSVPMPTRADDSFVNLRIPLPSARNRLETEKPVAEIAEKVLAEEGLRMSDLKVRGERRLFFSKGDRSAHVMPKDLELETGEDERHAGRRKLVLAFILPRGSYASLLVKRATTPSLP